MDKIRGEAIECHDCHQIGYIVYDCGDYILPPGWKMTWVRLRPLYLCGDCGRKRKQTIRKLLNLQ